MYYAKWNKSERERQILYGLIYMKNLNKQMENPTHKKKRWDLCLPEAGGDEKGN